MHTITVPTIPSVNHYVKHTKRGGHYATKQTKLIKKSIAAELFSCGQPEWVYQHIADKKPLCLKIIFALKKDLHKRDLDNMLKVFIDCLASRYKFNDSFIDSLILSKRLNDSKSYEAISFEFLTTEVRNEND
jgi:Holliday junction resolvase RusA-like endonuclease